MYDLKANVIEEKRMIRWRRLVMIISVLMLSSSIYVGYLHYKIIHYKKMEAYQSADYLIILGARVKGTTPSLSLQYRINTAAKYLKENIHTIAIASGGQGPDEDISEAEAIKRGLVSMGIDESRILLEDQSTNTYENIKFSKEIFSLDGKKAVIVTNDFHLYRARMQCEDQGLDATSLAAKTPTVAILKSYVREYLAITKYFLTK